VASLATELPGFVYHDSRDLTGFVDGSANPSPAEAPGVACVPPGQAGAGGSHVLAQRFVHDLRAFGELDVPDQERVFGRTKLESLELPDDVRPANAHMSRAEVHDDVGEERPIYRRSVPFGTLHEQGLFFLAFSAERDRFDQMLASIYGTDESDVRDRLLDFTTAVSGAYYFAPSLEDLMALGG
jgi:putative iron-dependent peroxidase